MKALYTWSMGPDILVKLNGTPLLLHEDSKQHKPPGFGSTHGHVKEGSIDLTLLEAQTFADQLVKAIEQVKQNENVLTTYMNKTKGKKLIT